MKRYLLSMILAVAAVLLAIGCASFRPDPQRTYRWQPSLCYYDNFNSDVYREEIDAAHPLIFDCTVVAATWVGPEVDRKELEHTEKTVYRDKRLTIRIDNVLKGTLPHDEIIVVVPELWFCPPTGPVAYFYPGKFRFWCDNADLLAVKNVRAWPKTN